MNDVRGAMPAVTRRAFVGGAIGLVVSSAVTRTDRAFAAEASWRLLPGDGPAGRWDHTLGADDEAKRLILFGGRDGNGASLSDTWLYDLSERAWHMIDSAGPEPRFGHAIAMDQKSRRLLLFGGQSADTFFNDTWLFDFESESWSKLESGESALPSARYGLSAVLDTNGQLIISHGFTFEGRFDDTWALDLDKAEWTDISPETGAPRPLKRCLHEMSWHPGSESLLLYGGCSSGFGPCPQGDLWQFDPEDRVWTELTPPDGPAARSNPALVYDDDSDRMLLIGGLSDSGYVNDAWQGTLLDGEFRWTPFTFEGDAPSPRASHDTVLTRGDLYLFGGTGDGGVTADLWKLSLT